MSPAHVQDAYGGSGEWTVTIRRDGDLDTDRRPPPVGDLPADIRAALAKWLEGET